MAYEIKIPRESLNPNIAIGIKATTEGSVPGVFISTYSTMDQAMSNLKNLILTYRGERPMQPVFGTRLRDALFEPNTSSVREFITTEITQAISYWLPYMSIINLSVQESTLTDGSVDEHGISVKLVVSINNQQSGVPITFFISTNSVQVL